ncbi:MAG TPA: HNH endonuclease signature motif containing protein [Solirubrobacterales bacterium]
MSRERGPKRRQGITRALVRDLLATGLSPAEVALRIGVTKSTVAFHMRRLDIEVDERCARRYDWAEIQRAYDSGLSVRECAARFGFNLASWHKAVLRGAIEARPAAMAIEQLLVKGRTQTNRSHLKQRLLSDGLKRNRCERCGLTEWQGKPLNMQLHHRNGDGTDNRLENLEILCPNCHAQTDTYGGRNGHRRKNAA